MKHVVAFALIAFFVFDFPLSGHSQATGSRTLRYGNRTEVGIIMGISKFKTDIINGAQLHAKNDEIIFNIQTINGFWYMNRLFIGLGIGGELWQHGLFWPVFGNITYNFTPRENTFYGSVNLGSSIGNRYGTTYYNPGTGGFMASLGLGYMVAVTKKLKFTYEIFYKYQVIKSTYQIKGDSIPPSHPIEYNVPENFIGFRIGIAY